MSQADEESSNFKTIGRAGARARANPQEEWARIQLLKEKLGAGHRFLTTQSEKEEVMGDILTRICDVRESTPEWSELCFITQTEDRVQQAEILAERAWEKKKEELIMAKYTGGAGKMQQTYNESQDKVNKVRQAPSALAGLLGGAGDTVAKAPLAGLFGSVFGR